jgi:hypothetical protein
MNVISDPLGDACRVMLGWPVRRSARTMASSCWQRASLRTSPAVVVDQVGEIGGRGLGCATSVWIGEVDLIQAELERITGCPFKTVH